MMLIITGLLGFLLLLLLPDILWQNEISVHYILNYGKYKEYFILAHRLLMLFNFGIVGLISFFYLLVRPKNYALVFFTSLLGSYGFFLGACSHLSLIIYLNHISGFFFQSPELVQQVILSTGFPSGYLHLLMVGLASLWWLVTSSMSWDHPFIPKHLGYLGFFIGCNYLLYSLGNFFQFEFIIKWGKVWIYILISLWSVFEFLFIKRMLKNFN